MCMSMQTSLPVVGLVLMFCRVVLSTPFKEAFFKKLNVNVKRHCNSLNVKISVTE